MVKFETILDGDKRYPFSIPRNNPEAVMHLVRQSFGLKFNCFSRFPNSNGFFLRISSSSDQEDMQETVAEIYPQQDFMRLFTPLYIEESRRFAQAYEDAFLEEGKQFRVSKEFCKK